MAKSPARTSTYGSSNTGVIKQGDWNVLYTELSDGDTTVLGSVPEEHIGEIRKVYDFELEEWRPTRYEPEELVATEHEYLGPDNPAARIYRPTEADWSHLRNIIEPLVDGDLALEEFDL